MKCPKCFESICLIIGGIGFALFLFIGISRPFESWSLPTAIPIGFASTIIIDWALKQLDDYS